MKIEYIKSYDVLEFAMLLEVFQKNKSKDLKIIDYEVKEDSISAEIADEFGTSVVLDLDFCQALINGEATNDSVKWNAFLVHKFGKLYISWLRTEKIKPIDIEFAEAVAGDPSIHNRLSAAARQREARILELNGYLMDLELMAQQLFEVNLEDKKGATLERKCPLVEET